MVHAGFRKRASWSMQDLENVIYGPIGFRKLVAWSIQNLENFYVGFREHALLSNVRAGFRKFGPGSNIFW